MSGFRLTPAACGDLEAIWDYTAEAWSVDQAERYVLAIHDRLAAIAEGRSVAISAEDVRSGYRKALVGMHVIYLRSAPDGGTEIVRILHQSMDAGRRLPRKS